MYDNLEKNLTASRNDPVQTSTTKIMQNIYVENKEIIIMKFRYN